MFQNISDMYGAKKEKAASCLRATKSRGVCLTGRGACIGIKNTFTGCSSRQLKRRDNFLDLGVGRKVILKGIISK